MIMSSGVGYSKKSVSLSDANGCGAVKLSELFLLINKIALSGDLSPNLVAATGIEPVTLGL